MQTIRMTVSRTGEAALITKDRLRVDVGADFYVSVTPQAVLGDQGRLAGARYSHADCLHVHACDLVEIGQGERAPVDDDAPPRPLASACSSRISSAG